MEGQLQSSLPEAPVLSLVGFLSLCGFTGNIIGANSWSFATLQEGWELADLGSWTSRTSGHVGSVPRGCFYIVSV